MGFEGVRGRINTTYRGRKISENNLLKWLCDLISRLLSTRIELKDCYRQKIFNIFAQTIIFIKCCRSPFYNLHQNVEEIQIPRIVVIFQLPEIKYQNIYIHKQRPNKGRKKNSNNNSEKDPGVKNNKVLEIDYQWRVGMIVRSISLKKKLTTKRAEKGVQERANTETDVSRIGTTN